MYRMTIVNTILDSTLKLNWQSTRHVVLIRNMEQMRSLCLEGALKSMGPIFQAQKETKKDDEKGREEVHEQMLIELFSLGSKGSLSWDVLFFVSTRGWKKDEPLERLWEIQGDRVSRTERRIRTSEVPQKLQTCKDHGKEPVQEGNGSYTTHSLYYYFR